MERRRIERGRLRGPAPRAVVGERLHDQAGAARDRAEREHVSGLAIGPADGAIVPDVEDVDCTQVGAVGIRGGAGDEHDRRTAGPRAGALADCRERGLDRAVGDRRGAEQDRPAEAAEHA